MGKVESERNRIQVPGEAQLHSGSDHAHFHFHSCYYSHFETYFIYVWHMAYIENKARRSSVSSAAGGNALTQWLVHKSRVKVARRRWHVAHVDHADRTLIRPMKRCAWLIAQASHQIA